MTEDEYSKIVREHRSQLVQYVQNRTSKWWMDPDEIVDKALERLWIKRDAFEEVENPNGSWMPLLYTMVKFTILDVYGSGTTQGRNYEKLRTFDLQVHDYLAPSPEDPELLWSDDLDFLNEDLRVGWSLIREQDRRLLWARDVEGLSYDQIREIPEWKDLTDPAISNRLSMARKRVRKLAEKAKQPKTPRRSKPMPMRRCRKCSVRKPATDYNYKRKYCKVCQTAEEARQPAERKPVFIDPAPEGFKTCRRCLEVKQLDEFYKNPRGNPIHRCKACISEYNREYHSKNKAQK